MAFIDGIKEKAKRDRKTIVLPETNDKRTLQAANEIIRDGIADLILVGDQEDPRRREMVGSGLSGSRQGH